MRVTLLLYVAFCCLTFLPLKVPELAGQEVEKWVPAFALVALVQREVLEDAVFDLTNQREQKTRAVAMIQSLHFARR
jgi:hypothetical protein